MRSQRTLRTSRLPGARRCGTKGAELEAGEAPMLYFSLGDFVTHPDQPDWGQGQVQSIVGTNVTVNFEHAGKQMINCQIIDLVKATRPRRD